MPRENFFFTTEVKWLVC